MRSSNNGFLQTLLTLQRQQMALDGEHVGIVLGKLSQRIGELEQIIAIRAARANGVCNLPCNLLFRSWPQVGSVIGSGDVSQALRMAPIIEGHILDHAQITVFLAVIQMIQDILRHQISDALTHRTILRHQSDHPPWRARRTPMVMRTLPETTSPAVNTSSTAVDVREINFENQ